MTFWFKYYQESNDSQYFQLCTCTYAEAGEIANSCWIWAVFGIIISILHGLNTNRRNKTLNFMLFVLNYELEIACMFCVLIYSKAVVDINTALAKIFWQSSCELKIQMIRILEFWRNEKELTEPLVFSFHWWLWKICATRYYFSEILLRAHHVCISFGKQFYSNGEKESNKLLEQWRKSI